MFQSVKSDFIERAQPHSELAFGKSFSVKPHQVFFRQITQQSAFVLAIGHGLGDQVDEDFRVHGPKVGFCFDPVRFSAFPEAR